MTSNSHPHNTIRKHYKKVYVYVLHNKESGYVKIGRSAAPDRRAANISIGSPVAITLAGKFLCNSHKAETDLHTMFCEHRKHGEWFDVPVERALDEAKKISEKYRFDETTFSKHQFENEKIRKERSENLIAGFRHGKADTCANPDQSPTIDPELYFAAARIARGIDLARDAGVKQALIWELQAIHKHLGLPFPAIHLFGKDAGQYQLEV